MLPNHATQTDPYLHECKGASTATAGQVLTASGSGTAAFADAVVGGSGAYIKTTSALSTTLITSTTLIPFDNTIPQLTEGTNLFNASVTPTTSGNKFRVTANIFGSYSVAAIVTAALFRDNAANAICAVATKVTAANDPFCFKLEWEITTTTASAVNLKIQVGGNTAGTITLNGNAAGAWFGGVAASTLTITEIKP